MTQNIDLILEIGASFRGEIQLVTDETGRTHRMQIRSEVGSTFVQMELSTGDGITADETKLSLYRGASVTEVLSLDTDTAHWVYDIESINNEDPDDVRRLARGLVLVSRDITRDTEPTPAANASKLLSYSLTDGQTLTSEEQEHVREKIGASGGGSTITTEDITDMTAIGREIATAEDAAAVRTALNVPSVDDIASYEFVSYQDQGIITDPAKAQARANMDAMSIYQGLRVDAAQGLDGDQKNQGRVNLDVPSNGALAGETTARIDQFNALDAYAQSIETALNNLDASLAVVAKTGDYNDLINKPETTIVTLQNITTAFPKPDWAKWIICEIWGQGGAGGSGRKGAAGTVACGGGAGSTAMYVKIGLAAAEVGATIACVVPGAPAGGAAVTIDNTDGNPGAPRTNTTVQLGQYTIVVPGGVPGSGGTASTGAGGTSSGTAFTLPFISVAGVVGASAQANGSFGLSGGNNSFGNAGSGAGGGVNAANTAAAGGGGGYCQISNTQISGGTGGAVGANGTQGTVPLGFHGGGGAGGGGGAVTGAAGNGANAVGYGGAGAGGGAARNGVGNSSGKGGDGTPGTVRFTFIP